MSVGIVTPSHLDDDYGLSRQVTTPLVPPWSDPATFDATVTGLRDAVAIDEEAVRVGLILLQHWHTMLVGPPGSGKTMLAEQCAALWNVKLIRVTPSMDWTAFHAIGGKAPRHGSLEPFDGVVTSAILDCCKTSTEYELSKSGPQATWLLIDEINRCEADRVFAALLTTLGSRRPPQSLDLPHHDDPLKRRIFLPPGFRIIATANPSDAQFVEQLSQAFIRRFQRLDVRIPAAPALQAIPVLGAAGPPSQIAEPFLQEFAVVEEQLRKLRPNAPQMRDALVLLGQLFLLVRYSLRWPGLAAAPEEVRPPFDTVALGTAQIVDAMLLALDLADSPVGLTLEDSVDVAAARTVAPQLSRMGLESLRGLRDELDRLQILPRVRHEVTQAIIRFESGSYV